MRRHRATGRAVAAVVGATIALTACGVQPDAAPRDLPEDERPILVDVGPSGSSAAGANRIFLVGPGDDRLLRSVPRQAETRRELIEVLLAGPNDDELAAQYSSFIPPTTELISSRTQGQVITINLSGGITELSGQNLAQAVAQIVYTASELDGVEAVQLRVDGEELAWPKANGETTSEPLRIYDYPNLVVTAQPEFPPVPAQS
ncbi:MAG: GerMN domain-containing protein [Acidimicrobiia bacterium]